MLNSTLNTALQAECLLVFEVIVVLSCFSRRDKKIMESRARFYNSIF